LMQMRCMRCDIYKSSILLTGKALSKDGAFPVLGLWERMQS
jgi:hypothetical protein